MLLAAMKEFNVIPEVRWAEKIDNKPDAGSFWPN